MMETGSDALADILRRTRPWVLLMAIMFFIGVALMLITGVGMGLFGLASGEPEALAMMIVYPVFALLYIMPGVYLWQYASRIERYITDARTDQLASALDAQRSFWKFTGVLTIVGCVIGIVGVAAAILIPLFLRMSGRI
jgi:predicted transcriptional regulator